MTDLPYPDDRCPIIGISDATESNGKQKWKAEKEMIMVHEYSLLGKIICKWLGLHWGKGEPWEYLGYRHDTCRICGIVFFKKARKK